MSRGSSWRRGGGTASSLPLSIGCLLQVPRLLVCLVTSTVEFFAYGALLLLLLWLLRDAVPSPAHGIAAVAGVCALSHFRVYHRLEGWIAQPRAARLLLLAAHGVAGLWAGWMILHALSAFTDASPTDLYIRAALLLVPVYLNLRGFRDRHGLNLRNLFAP